MLAKVGPLSYQSDVRMATFQCSAQTFFFFLPFPHRHNVHPSFFLKKTGKIQTKTVPLGTQLVFFPYEISIFPAFTSIQLHIFFFFFNIVHLLSVSWINSYNLLTSGFGNVANLFCTPLGNTPTFISCTCPEVQLPWGNRMDSVPPSTHQIVITYREVNNKLILF